MRAYCPHIAVAVWLHAALLFVGDEGSVLRAAEPTGENSAAKTAPAFRIDDGAIGKLLIERELHENQQTRTQLSQLLAALSPYEHTLRHELQAQIRQLEQRDAYLHQQLQGLEEAEIQHRRLLAWQQQIARYRDEATQLQRANWLLPATARLALASDLEQQLRDGSWQTHASPHPTPQARIWRLRRQSQLLKQENRRLRQQLLELRQQQTLPFSLRLFAPQNARSE